MSNEKKGIGAHLGGHLRESGMLLALVAIVVFFTLVLRFVPPSPIDFLSAQNITNLFLQNSYVIIMALGMLMVIVAGHAFRLDWSRVQASTDLYAPWLWHTTAGSAGARR